MPLRERAFCPHVRQPPPHSHAAYAAQTAVEVRALRSVLWEQTRRSAKPVHVSRPAIEHVLRVHVAGRRRDQSRLQNLAEGFPCFLFL